MTTSKDLETFEKLHKPFKNEIEKEIITRMSNGKPIGLGLNKNNKQNIKDNEIEKEFNLSDYVTEIQERKAFFIRDLAAKEFIRLANEIILMDISNCEKSDRFKLLAGASLI